MRLLRSAICAAAALLISGGIASAAYYATANYAASGSDWEIGGTLNIQTGGKLTFNGVQVAPSLAGEVALSGTNPTAVATGFTTVNNCALTIKESSAPGVGTTTLTYTDSGGTLDIYAWKPTSSSNPTLVASTGTETVGWRCGGS